MRALRTLLIAALITAPLLTVPVTADAQVSEQGYEETPKHFVTGLSFGAMWLNDANIQATYTTKGRFMTKLTLGLVPWSRYVHVEILGSFGFLQFTGTQTFIDSGADSADSVMMTIFPFNVDLLVGIDIFEEQPVVPFGGVGFALTLWREHETGGGDVWNGDRLGGNVFFGANILLDSLERTRAQHLDVTTGINDAFLTIEGRWANVKTQIRDGALSTEGLGFGGWSFHAGLKLVY